MTRAIENGESEDIYLFYERIPQLKTILCYTISFQHPLLTHGIGLGLGLVSGSDRCEFPFKSITFF